MTVSGWSKTFPPLLPAFSISSDTRDVTAHRACSWNHKLLSQKTRYVAGRTCGRRIFTPRITHKSLTSTPSDSYSDEVAT